MDGWLSRRELEKCLNLLADEPNRSADPGRWSTFGALWIAV
jgi:hypothetical protein